MEFLAHFLPIIIYFLLIIIIIVGIVLGIKLIITIDKVVKIVDDVNEKIESVSPLFNALSLASSKAGEVIEKVIGAIENLIFKLFLKNKNDEEMESGDSE